MVVDHLAKVVDLLRSRRNGGRIAGESAVGRSNEREVALERQREHHATVGVLEDIAAVVVEELSHHDVAALDEAKLLQWLPPEHRRLDDACPWSGRIDQRARGYGVAPAARLERQLPALAALGPHAAGARADRRATLGGIKRIEHDEACIVGVTVGIFEALAVALLERASERIAREIDAARARQNLAAAEVIVEEEPEPQHP